MAELNGKNESHREVAAKLARLKTNLKKKKIHFIIITIITTSSDKE